MRGGQECLRSKINSTGHHWVDKYAAYLCFQFCKSSIVSGRNFLCIHNTADVNLDLSFSDRHNSTQNYILTNYSFIHKGNSTLYNKSSHKKLSLFNGFNFLLSHVSLTNQIYFNENYLFYLHLWDWLYIPC